MRAALVGHRGDHHQRRDVGEEETAAEQPRVEADAGRVTVARQRDVPHQESEDRETDDGEQVELPSTCCELRRAAAPSVATPSRTRRPSATRRHG